MRAGSVAGAATVLIAEGIASWYAVESRNYVRWDFTSRM